MRCDDKEQLRRLDAPHDRVSIPRLASIRIVSMKLDEHEEFTFSNVMDRQRRINTEQRIFCNPANLSVSLAKPLSIHEVSIELSTFRQEGAQSGWLAVRLTIFFSTLAFEQG